MATLHDTPYEGMPAEGVTLMKVPFALYESASTFQAVLVHGVDTR